jgi:hypothetical protein
MTEIRRKLLGLGYTALAMVAAPAAALAQTAASPSPAAPSADWSAASLVGIVGVLLGLFVAVGIAVKIYDAKRRRDEQGVALQARLSDALLLTPSLIRMPVVASVHMPLRRGSPPVVELKGTVPTPEAREIALRVVQHELAGINAQLKDQMVVDPQGVRKVAA